MLTLIQPFCPFTHTLTKIDNVHMNLKVCVLISTYMVFKFWGLHLCCCRISAFCLKVLSPEPWQVSLIKAMKQVLNRVIMLLITSLMLHLSPTLYSCLISLPFNPLLQTKTKKWLDLSYYDFSLWVYCKPIMPTRSCKMDPIKANGKAKQHFKALFQMLLQARRWQIWVRKPVVLW